MLLLTLHGAMVALMCCAAYVMFYTHNSLTAKGQKYKKKIHNLDKQAPLNQFSSPLQKDRPNVLSHPVEN